MNKLHNMADDPTDALTQKPKKRPAARYYEVSAEEEKPTEDRSGAVGDEPLERKTWRKKGEEKERRKIKRGRADPFEGPAPVPKEKLVKYSRGEQVNTNNKNVPDVKHRRILQQLEKKYEEAVEEAARSELLLTEDAGYLEADSDEETHWITQREIAAAVDISSAQKHFDLKLTQFGPYRLDYTRNGRHLLLGGKRGHLAAIDWMTKGLTFEINVMETIRDVRWLHLETMLAVAQKKWLYMYDNQGTEIHCLKGFNDVLRMEFLPYHFLLATASATGFLQYLDTSIGKEVISFPTRQGRLNVMTQNPHNAIIHLGHPNGTVTLWSPNMKQPLVKMLCHKAAVRSIAIDNKGLYMATSGQDSRMKIFDVRTFKPLQVYKIPTGASELSFSQRGLIAAACGNIVQVYKDACTQTQDKPYMMHKLRDTVNGLRFCPYEDVLGVSHVAGFSSLLVPGAGEANFDALEQNPYRSKQSRREWEVKALLDKIQPEMITLDTNKLSQIDTATMEQRLSEKKDVLGYIPAPKFEPRYKMKGKSSAGKREQRKKGVQEEQKRDFLKKEIEKREEVVKERKAKEKEDILLGKRSALDRFQKKSS
ncbi:WD repeat-containing protein 46-like isoform X1 [Ptychodera flava]|uniref:WD repeat-containing protein 46-like isoform X1 n=1 Tax=Ptychodera flava TaxID=63121 RepID=UPI003969E6A7